MGTINKEVGYVLNKLNLALEEFKTNLTKRAINKPTSGEIIFDMSRHFMHFENKMINAIQDLQLIQINLGPDEEEEK